MKLSVVTLWTNGLVEVPLPARPRRRADTLVPIKGPPSKSALAEPAELAPLPERRSETAPPSRGRRRDLRALDVLSPAATPLFAVDPAASLPLGTLALEPLEPAAEAAIAPPAPKTKRGKTKKRAPQAAASENRAVARASSRPSRSRSGRSSSPRA